MHLIFGALMSILVVLFGICWQLDQIRKHLESRTALKEASDNE